MTGEMKNLTMLAVAAIACQLVHADALTPADREALLERLEKLRASAESRIEARYRAAISAYTSAAGSESAASDLYLKCVEKVNFTDQNRRAADFREWRRRESDRLSATGFGLALQLQLRWLILTLQAASGDADRAQLAANAQTIVNTIASEASKLAGQQQVLNQAVTASFFARAYDIGGVDVENWPLAPGQIGQIYDQILLPPLRQQRKVQELRAAWTRRIQQEMTRRENMPSDSGGRRIGMAAAMRGPDYDRFVAETLPELQWQMETDLLRHGDERGAATRMLAHIEKNITHKSARKWTEELERLLNPAARTAGATP